MNTRPDKVKLLENIRYSIQPDYFGKRFQVTIPAGAVGIWCPVLGAFLFNEHKKQGVILWQTYMDLWKNRSAWEPINETSPAHTGVYGAPRQTSTD